MIDLDHVKHIYVACGYTDLRKGIDGYASIADGKLNLNPFDNTIFLFCVRDIIKITKKDKVNFTN